MRLPLPRALVVFATAASLALAGSARAQDAFEIQVYDAETAPPGDVGVEIHFNNVVVGTEQSMGSEIPTNHVSHLTLEPHVGIASWCEAGAYIQTAIRADGTFDFAGIKLRFKARVPRRLAGLVGLSLNGELSSVPAIYEAQIFGSELRPTIDVRWRRLYAAVNPILSIDLAGPLAGHPQFEPAAKLAVNVIPLLSVGAEYYAALGALDQLLPSANQTHRLFGVVDFEHGWGRFKLDATLGVGYGFSGTEKWIVKLILGFDFDRGT